MTSLDFLYIALGGGFLLLMVFLSVLILHLTILLRDVAKVTDDLREVSGKVKEVVFEPLKALSELSASFGFVNDIIERIKSRYAQHMDEIDEEDEEVEEKPAKKTDAKSKSGFFVKKLNK